MRLFPFFLPILAVAACGSDPVAKDEGTSPSLPAENPPASDAGDASSTTDAADAGDAADANEGGAPEDSTDGICTQAPVTTGIYDPDCVYLVGTLLPGSAGWDVLVDPAAPSVRAHGFGHYFSSPMIRPKDGRMVWHTFDDLWVFHPDNGPVNAEESIVVANDDAVATPGCSEGVYKPFVFPDDSKIGYQCFQSQAHPDFAQHLFVEGESVPIASGGAGVFPIAAGAKRSVLFRKESTGALSVWDGKAMHAVVDPTPHRFVAATRFRGGAFRVAQVAGNTLATTTVDLQRIALDGTVTVLGSYQLGTPVPSFFQCVLDPSDRLTCFTWETSGSDKIVRFALGAPPIVVFDEAGAPVQIHISELVTGP